ncbi:MAG: NAD(P)-dependent glycerol-3-phosphate dehydrogenase [Abditibacteriales bacterium]|nr:NAD(P)-dependent glycerol-3-phosphate dehydrogenase [Abditibacteriales bacterium]MDW8366072.1 NAD(P)H-dependent glycerol-3-phosphate dehydrogenase [Abditibacteriales bacterium]
MLSTKTKDILAVIGAGSWGTALAHLLAPKVREVRLWVRSAELADLIRQRRMNEKYLPGVTLPENVAVTSHLADAVAGVEFVVLAVPCVGVPTVCEALAPVVSPTAILVSATKGLHNDSGLRPSQIIAHTCGGAERIAVLSGPNLAREVVSGIPTTTVIAASNPEVSQRAQVLFSTPTFRVYTNSDVVGVELGGALKNIIAIAAGINDGLGFGDNTKAALATRGLVEMTRLGIALGGKLETFFGLSGVGDLFATCASRHSRNHHVGFRLGRGETLAEIQASMTMIAEGIPTTQAAFHRARELGIDMPITEQIHAVLFEGKNPRQAVADLMSRRSKAESTEDYSPWRKV